MNKRRILALIGIGFLVLLYLSNLILALIGSDYAQVLLKVSTVCTIAIPIILYGFMVVMKSAGNDKKVDIADDETGKEK